MKVEEIESAFVPVKITLESQEEVNKLFAIMNFNPISEAVEVSGWYGKLSKYKNAGYSKWHKALVEIAK